MNWILFRVRWGALLWRINRLRGECGSRETIGAMPIVEAGIVVAGTRVAVADTKEMVGLSLFWKMELTTFADRSDVGNNRN